MIFEMYGKCAEGLEQNRLAILRNLSRDFKTPGKRIAPVACGSFCESRGWVLVAQDADKRDIDTSLPESQEAYSKAIQRNRQDWKPLMQPGQKKVK